MTEYELHPLAEEEMNEAARFYEGRLSGLGDDFLDEFERCVSQIVSYPESGQRCYEYFRRSLIARFPFSVVYELLPNGILIVAVAHQRRRPGYWRGRIVR